MKTNDAVKLIEFENNELSKKQIWADLGCGTGTFTEALANLLPNESVIYAIDESESALSKIPNQIGSVSIIKQVGNFELNFPLNLDGILMANSLHYVKDKKLFLKNSIKHFQDSCLFMIVEYDLNSANTWVPYPINFDSLKKLFMELGFTQIEKLLERKSVYQRANLYASLIKKQNLKTI